MSQHRALPPPKMGGFSLNQPPKRLPSTCLFVCVLACLLACVGLIFVTGIRGEVPGKGARASLGDLWFSGTILFGEAGWKVEVS